MKVQAKIDYACKALLELAKHWPNQVPLQVNEIAERQHLPIKFLIQILIVLKQFGYVESVRGQKGGYVLAKPPKEIKLGNLFKSLSASTEGMRKGVRSRSDEVFDPIWQEGDRAMLRVLDTTTFDELVKREQALHKIPLYAI